MLPSIFFSISGFQRAALSASFVAEAALLRSPAAALTFARGVSVAFCVVFDRFCGIFEAKRRRTVVLVVSPGDRHSSLPYERVQTFR